MEVYKELAKHPVFSINDVKKLSGNINTAYSQLNRLMKKGMIKKIRKNIYSVVNLATDQILANRYQIACAITDTSYISHHTAFEYYGLTNQVFYEVYVSSESKFNHFEFEGITYKYISSRIKEGVVEAKNTTGVRITDIERTVTDNKIGGIEELLNSLDNINYLDESKLKKYLDIYNTQSLYQKTGYILNYYREELQISKEFIEYCNKKIGKSSSYLSNEIKDDTHYNSKWKLVIPNRFFNKKGVK
jgi:predicted transcriptional regulator of viral defense system